MEDLLLPALKQDTSECSYFYNLYNITREYIFSVHNIPKENYKEQCGSEENGFISFHYGRSIIWTHRISLILIRLGKLQKEEQACP